MLAYRRDIDGLRALAVCVVLAFHAFPGGFRGGFIGVDIFFVISGFLISSIILRGLEAGTFTFRDFYIRRICRLFPSLVVVLLFCLGFGALALFPDELSELGKHVAAGAGYVSNFVLWQEAGYFDRASEVKPLLHLWSLAIEEQFYIVCPLALYLLHARKKALAFFLLCATASSLAFSCYSLGRDATEAYYAPHSRFWELLTGSLLAWWALQRERHGEEERSHPANGAGWPQHLLSVLGLTLIVAGLALYRQETPFPGLAALAPVLGAALIIAAGEKAWVNKSFLSHKGMVGIGIISYPLYLWHWPLLSLSRIVQSTKPSPAIRLSCLLLTFLLAWLSYRFLETPLRRRNLAPLKASVLFVLMLALGCLGYGIHLKEGLPERFVGTTFFKEKSPEDIHIEKLMTEALQRGLQARSIYAIEDGGLFLQRPPGQNSIAVLGDSHAGHLFYGLLEQAEKSDEAIALFSENAAIPFMDIFFGEKYYSPDFNPQEKYLFREKSYQAILQDAGIRCVVLAHYPKISYEMPITDLQNPNEKDNTAIMEAGLRRTLAALHKAGKKVLIVLDNPRLPFEDPQICLERPFRLVDSRNECTFDRSLDDQYPPKRWYEALVLNVLKDFPDTAIVNLSDAFCDDTTCYAARNDVLLYADNNHISFPGSRQAASLLWPAILEILRR